MPQPYRVIIDWSEDDKVFVARVPDLPGCAAHGSSPDEALESCQQAIELWIETAEEFGRLTAQP